MHGHKTALLGLSLVQADKILVFEGLQAASFLVVFSLAVNSATLEIENALNLLRALNLHRVRHQHHVHDFETRNLHRENAIDSCEERSAILLEMCKVGLGHHLAEEFHLLARHRLHNKLFVIAEEEEAA